MQDAPPTVPTTPRVVLSPRTPTPLTARPSTARYVSEVSRTPDPLSETPRTPNAPVSPAQPPTAEVLAQAGETLPSVPTTPRVELLPRTPTSPVSPAQPPTAYMPAQEAPARVPATPRAVLSP